MATAYVGWLLCLCLVCFMRSGSIFQNTIDKFTSRLFYGARTKQVCDEYTVSMPRSRNWSVFVCGFMPWVSIHCKLCLHRSMNSCRWCGKDQTLRKVSSDLEFFLKFLAVWSGGCTDSYTVCVYLKGFLVPLENKDLLAPSAWRECRGGLVRNWRPLVCWFMHRRWHQPEHLVCVCVCFYLLGNQFIINDVHRWAIRTHPSQRVWVGW